MLHDVLFHYIKYWMTDKERKMSQIALRTSRKTLLLTRETFTFGNKRIYRRISGRMFSKTWRENNSSFKLCDVNDDY